MQPSDAEVISAVLNGDGDAFRAIVERYSRGVFRLAWRLTRSESDADDIVQEAFLRAFRHLDRYDRDMPFQSWIYRIATNCAMDLLRSRERKREEVLETELGDRDGRFLSGDPTPDRALAGVEVRKLVNQTLETLSPSERTAFSLRHQEGMSIAEISRVLGKNENATKHSIFRAVQKLRTALSPLVGVSL
jgi:RNA polymerase sigma-70 factor (ECF subfamily)